ncbi:hypothetical protein [Beijerinckia sp. L45]|uniref:hypothetical protein n=1 Tax=Beijerinckia sp. L45 TaxID=1641855 RepID=UPI00131ED044|nr:hypothetical protein [Beijerinckia sp. L45]
MIGSLNGFRLVSSDIMVDTVEDWSRVRSPGRARRRRWKHRQNIVLCGVPKTEVLIIDATPFQPAMIVGHPTVIAALVEKTKLAGETS